MVDSLSGIDSDSDEVIGPLALTPRKPASVKDSKGCDALQPAVPGFFNADVLGRLWRRLVSYRFTPRLLISMVGFVTTSKQYHKLTDF